MFILNIAYVFAFCTAQTFNIQYQDFVFLWIPFLQHRKILLIDFYRKS